MRVGRDMPSDPKGCDENFSSVTKIIRKTQINRATEKLLPTRLIWNDAEGESAHARERASRDIVCLWIFLDNQRPKPVLVLKLEVKQISQQRDKTMPFCSFVICPYRSYPEEATEYAT